MKRFISVILCGIMLLSLSYTCSAAPIVSEKPDLIIYNDCSQFELKDTPITINNVVLLTDNDIFRILGIKVDNKNITWDAKKKTLAFSSGKVKAIVTIGSVKAIINNKNVTLGLSPLMYKNKRYLPVASIIDAFGKVAVQDDILPRYYIRDKSEFNNIKTILEKSISVMNSLESFKISTKSSYTSLDLVNNVTREGKDSSTADVSRKNQIYFYYSEDDLGGKYFKFYYYNVNKTNYSYSEYDNDPGDWGKKPIKSFEKELAGSDYRNYINARDSLYAILKLSYTPDNKSLIMNANLFPLNNFQQNDKSWMKSYKKQAKDGSIEIVVDTATNYISKVTVRSVYMDATRRSDSTYGCEYGNFNNISEIKLPDYIVEDQKNNSENNVAVADEPALSDSERDAVDTLEDNSALVAVDGGYSEPYGLKVTEAMLFIILKNKGNYDSFNGLSEYAKKTFINECVQDSYGQYLGCEVVHALVVYDGKKYVSSDAGYDSKPSELVISICNGEAVNPVIQDKSKNTYQNYYK
ncbi:MAG TPA: copper amine oxidase N-terminal domain-containing protein [Clostridia bacterium]|nr:copper amine oxidase N-terminal domain-containing protein [Clostridia bacterium]